MQMQTIDQASAALPNGGRLVAVPVDGPDGDALARSARENLRHLVGVCVDSLEALRQTAALLDDPTERRQLARIAAVRAATRNALERELLRLGTDADVRGTVSSVVHQLINRFRIATSGKDPVVALIALETAEDRVRRVFLDALRTKMPLAVEEAIRATFRQVLRCHDAVCGMVRQAKSAA